MELKQAIETRTSVRVYKNEPVPLEDLKEMVRLGNLAPSVADSRPWTFVIITNKDLLHNMAGEVARQLEGIPEKESLAARNIKSQVEWFSTFFQDAPAVIAVAMEQYESVLELGVQLSHDEINRIRNYPDIQSAGACIQNILLAAVDMNYGACWLSAPMIAREALEKMMGLDEKFKLTAFVAVGRPANIPPKKAGKDIEEIIRVII